MFEIVTLLPGILVQLENQTLYLRSSLGTNTLTVTDETTLHLTSNTTIVIACSQKSLLRTYRTLLYLKMKGLTRGFKQILTLKGVGFKATLEGSTLTLLLGYSHPVTIPIPESIQVKIHNKGTMLTFRGVDHLKLNALIHRIRSMKKPEIYKGKGVLLKHETVVLKEGKKSKR